MPGPDTKHAPDTVGPAVRQAAADLRQAGIAQAGDDARRLAAAALGLSTAQLLARPEQPIGPEQAARLAQYIARRRRREPVSRILGERAFHGRSFAISPATLDPRPDSETLIAAALELAGPERGCCAPFDILDVGTGSGCLLLTLLCELPAATGLGTDISEAALATARANADRLGVGQRVRWCMADALQGIGGPFDMLVCNPPYIPSAEIARLEPEVRLFDPPSALDGGADGLDLFRRIVRVAPAVIPNGWLILEVGHDQADAVADLLRGQAPAIDRDSIVFYPDVAGRRRGVAARTRN